MDGLNFTRRVETLLASRGIGKIQFYKDCGISDASFSQWKSGKFNPSKRSVKKVADYFKIHISEFEQKESPLPVSSKGTTIDVSDLNAANKEKVKEYAALLLNAQRTEQP